MKPEENYTDQFQVQKHFFFQCVVGDTLYGY